jgi:hypothetical protein
MLYERPAVRPVRVIAASTNEIAGFRAIDEGVTA